MAYVNRTDDELVSALEIAIGKSFRPDEVALSCPDDKCPGSRLQYTYKELLEEFRQRTAFGLKYLEAIRECARKGDRDPLDWIGHYSKSE